jgi:divalent metal cation (Fe/Co/Zn/Cd) transporter
MELHNQATALSEFVAVIVWSVLIGVGLNALLGWWWADPLAGFVIVYYGLTEGRAAWKHASADVPARLF